MKISRRFLVGERFSRDLIIFFIRAGLFDRICNIDIIVFMTALPDISRNN